MSEYQYYEFAAIDRWAHWAAVEALTGRGSASGYAQAVRALIDLAEGHALTPSRKELDLALRRLLVRHATRGALPRRLAEAGLWSTVTHHDERRRRQTHP
ncbi:hypothetical protein [Variovorax sp. YR216]|uniref:hypothetical protein n=1 Tax=Variovorax sp. YR216 TaxID=1882828 RepID=UPI000895AF9B|nr:hypothetical protein [Variovorax sp. YR216]SEB22665.1 hypothetical protein SAMN05444680_116120 [Variovorax sp. YR216]